MIDKQELRIGNVFHTINPNDSIALDTVVSLRSKSKSYAQLLVKSNRSGWLQETQCHPIPLSPEILEKACGFEVDELAEIVNGYTQYKKFEHYFFTGWLNNKNHFCLHYLGTAFHKHPKYLHELQNAIFILTGTELQVNESALKEAIKQPA